MEQENEDETVDSRVNSNFTRSQISQLTMFISWTWHQLNEEQQNTKLYVMQCFTLSNIQKYFDFQIKNCGKTLLTQASYFRNMFECFRFVVAKLMLWICTLNISDNSIKIWEKKMTETQTWIPTFITEVNFKNKIWTNMIKHSVYLRDHGLEITKADLKKVEAMCVKIIQTLHTTWCELATIPDTRKQLWNIRGYHVMESQVWLVLLHLWFFGIRPASLLQVKKSAMLCQTQEHGQFTISFKFLGFDKSQTGGVDRRLGFSKLTEEFLTFAYGRIPIAHEFYGRDVDSSVLFLSYKGYTLQKDSVCEIIKTFYGAVLQKYCFPRLIRFWLGHYAYEVCKDSDSEVLKVCYLFNHSITTHMKYYVCSDKIVEHDPSNDSTFYETIMNN